jgi:hypothetical protein
MARDILGLQANRHHQKDGVKTEGVTKSKYAYGMLFKNMVGIILCIE